MKQVTANSVTVAPYIRWSYYQNDAVRLFLDGTAAIGFVKIKDGDTTINDLIPSKEVKEDISAKKRKMKTKKADKLL